MHEALSGYGTMTLSFWKNSICTALIIGVVALISSPAWAVKKVPTIRIEVPKQDAQSNAPDTSEVPAVPLDESDLAPSVEVPGDEAVPEDQEKPKVETEKKDDRAPAKVLYGDENLPEPVKTLRAKLIEIARSGDIEKLRPLFETFEEAPLLSFDDVEDPIEHLKQNSGDGEGREILAILLEVLESGYVNRDKGQDGDIYIWPYFVEIPPEDLSPSQQVELFQIITAGDFEDMKTYGTYIFYRLGITPNGDLKFFIAGD